MNFRRRLSPGLKAVLISQRPMTSLIDQDIAAVSGDLVVNKENWILMYEDRGHGVSFDRGKTTAYRGIDHKGTLMWMVRTQGKLHGFHSLTTDPVDAIEDAERAWADRRRVRRDWSEVEAIARDLISGRQRFRVMRDDAYRSPLCSPGIDAFMERIGCARASGLNGRFAALLMRIEPQLGYAIYEAHKRVSMEMTPADDVATASPL